MMVNVAPISSPVLSGSAVKDAEMSKFIIKEVLVHQFLI